MRLAEGMAARDEGDGFLVIHRHTAKGFTNIIRCRNRIGVAVRTFGIHIDQAHLSCGQRFLELAVLIAVTRHEFGSRAPVDEIGLPIVFATAAKAEGLEAHGFQGHVACQDHQVAPGNFLAILFLDRPQQPTGLVKIRIVRPAVQRLEPLLSATRAAAPVMDAIGTGPMPGHADEEWPVVSIIRRPPVL
jgi:hypothetical protein